MKENSPSPLSEATAFHLAGNFGEAESRYRSLLNEQADAVTHNNLAFLLSQQGRYEESVEQYRMSLALSPGYTTALTNLGQTLLHLGKYEEAGEMLQKALALDADDYHTNKGLANLNIVNECFGEAEQYLKKSYSIRPSAELLMDLSWCLLSQGKLQEAADTLGYAEDTAKDGARYHALWGHIHFAGNNFGQSIYCFRQSLGIEPENIESRNNLVACLLKTGNTNDAVREMQRILLMDPGHTESLNNIAVLELATGNIDKALLFLEQALAADPENGKALFYKAMICYQQENTQEAMRILRHLDDAGVPAYAEKARDALQLFQTDQSTSF